ncbi:MAG: nitroreductase family protein [Syntrophaceae bacterium]|nr:nitroreductase family protein [Syntrophaceae bacterium]
MFQELINKRQSIRQYKAGAVPSEAIDACIEAARLAPSACNAQPWKFVVVDDEALKQQVGEAAASLGMNKFCQYAPCIVAVVLEKSNLTSAIGSVLKDKEYKLIDIGIAAEHFCLQATELGLGTCIIGWFNEKKVQQLLGIPKNKRIPLLITVGYPDDPQREKVRKTTGQMFSRNRY